MTNTSIRQLIVFGDSTVYGWGDIDGGGWCARLQRYWMQLEDKPTIYQLGIRGDGLEKVAQRWHREWECRGEFRRAKPTGLLLSIGLNDTAKVGREDGRPQLSKDAFRFGLEELLKKIKKETYVMVMGLTPVDESKMPYANCLWYSNQDCLSYERLIEECCLELDIPFLPTFQELRKETLYEEWIMSDGIHLNSQGHQWLFKKVLAWHPLSKWASE
ncbi:MULTISPECIES: GDSL-type esterase/lipase family protein [unclassified Prochlorococcus]|uniref:GDSL-type esterase/lipase family protein n=1 Tax=unclassified Prochlorococcus TaxID=2627481 RepID=UPI000533A7CD|nr:MULTISPECIES: GDSL-type esterase/lipase family protein [unclassified Prochlorococcus]KGG15347.1 hypothetical protein EV06_1218 [Prochlorococcus sp. MIT 0602]KGG17625.1 hypothetical protein EV07_1065 [Prochlorococcus sp. MIT 0603]